jgi:hypothetical protein
VKFSYEDNPFAPQEVIQEELKLPELEGFQYGSLEDVPPLEESLATTDDGLLGEATTEPGEEELRHLWYLVIDDPPISSQIGLYSWEAFHEPNRREPPSAYLSEAGNAAFDVALYLQQKEIEPPSEISVIRNDVFLQSIFALGLGRSSALFRYDSRKKQFEQMDSEHNVSGLSKQSANSVVKKMTDCGRLIRHLRDFGDRTYPTG